MFQVPAEFHFRVGLKRIGDQLNKHKTTIPFDAGTYRDCIITLELFLVKRFLGQTMYTGCG